MGLGVNLVLAGHLARPEVSQTMQPWAWHLVVSRHLRGGQGA